MKKIILQWGRPSFSNAELKAIIKTFKSGWLTMGQKVKVFEKKMSKYIKFDLWYWSYKWNCCTRHSAEVPEY